MEGIEYYRALYKYIPKETDDTEDADQIPDIPLDKDDILEVKHPISDDIQKPTGWLIGYNKNQKLCGYFPGPYVEHITPQMVQMAPQIGESPTQLHTDHCPFLSLNGFYNTYTVKHAYSEVPVMGNFALL